MKPFYEDGNSLVSVSNSILRYFGLDTFHETSRKLDSALDKNKDKKICLVLFDGFGKKIREVYRNESPFINSGRYQTITSVFPPTTVAATTSLMSGLYPCETGWLGWTEKFPDTEYDVLMFASAYNRVRTDPLFFNTKVRLPWKSIVEIMNEKGIKASDLHSFQLPLKDDIDSYFEETQRLLNENGFVYSYHVEPDHSLHEFGVGCEELKPIIKRLDKGLERLVKNNPDTVFIVLADHGHRNAKYVSIDEHADFYSLLSYPYVSLEARAVTFFVKEGKKDEFKKLGEKYYSDHFYVLDHDEVKNSHIFGIGKECELFDDLIGDFLFVSKDDYAFSDEGSALLVSHHAGSSDDEMLIDVSLFGI